MQMVPTRQSLKYIRSLDHQFSLPPQLHNHSTIFNMTMKLTTFLVLTIATAAMAVDRPPSQWKCRDGDRKCLAGETVGECRAKGWHIIDACVGPFAKCVEKPEPHCTHGA